MRKLSMADLERKTVTQFKEAKKIPIIVLLENIRSGYNVGSLFRTGDAFLIEAIYLVGYCPIPPHKEIKKTALGAEETVSWKHFNTSAEAIDELKKEGFTVYAVEQVENSTMLHHIHYDAGQKLAIVLGNEVTGVEVSTLLACDGVIEIPQLGMKHSLNIATAAGVVLWELVRTQLLQHNEQ